MLCFYMQITYLICYCFIFCIHKNENIILLTDDRRNVLLKELRISYFVLQYIWEHIRVKWPVIRQSFAYQHFFLHEKTALILMISYFET